MAANQSTPAPTTGLPLLPRLPEPADLDLLELEDDLSFRRASLASLFDLPETVETKRQIVAVKFEIADLQKRLGEARRSQSGASGSADPTVGSRRLQTLGAVPVKQEHLSSAMSNISNMSSSANSRAGTPSHQRKRSYGSSHLDAGDAGRLESKSRKSTPISWQSNHTTSDLGYLDDDFGDPIHVIDLTGDDDTWSSVMKKMEEEENRFRHNKTVAESDEAFARTLAGHPPSHSSSPFGQTSRHTQGGAFDRMLGRSNPPIKSDPGLAHPDPKGYQPHASVKREPSSNPIQNFPGSRLHPAHPAIKSEGTGSNPWAVKLESRPSWTPGPQPDTKYKVPGAFVDSDEEIEPGRFKTATHATPSWPQPQNLDRPALSSNLNLPQRPAGFGSSLQFAERASQAALRAGAHASMVYGPYATAQKPNPPFSGYGPVLGSSIASVHDINRPGYMQNGSYFGYPSMPQYAPLSATINRVNGYNFDDFTDVDGQQLDSHLVGFLQDYVEDPRRTEEEIQNLLSNIRPDMDIPAEERGETPEALKYPLYPHQQLALKWMSDMETGSNKGGILADDMGLGKTISALSLMVTRKSTDNVKTNLIIGPVALIRQWELEIKKKLKTGHKLSVLLLHQRKKLAYQDLKIYDVVLTTYGSIAAEWKRYSKHVEQRNESARYDPTNDDELHKKCPIVHPKSKFYRIILDEAQCIKNKDTQSSKAAHHIEATYRWCLTGTPMMNGVSELYPLIRFLRIKPYSSQKLFTQAFSSLTAKGKATEYQKSAAMRKLQAVLKAIMLRRMKNSQIDGKPILTLPPKTQLQDHVVFSEDELKFYKDLEAKTQVQFNKYLRAGTVGKNYSNILVLLLRLRQACCHPHLMDFECVGANETSEEQMLALARSLDPGVIERVKANDAFECPICYDAVEDPTIIIPCGHDTCSECFASLTDSAAQGNIRSGNENVAAPKCPVCRGPIDPMRIINYMAFQRVHMPDKVPNLAPAVLEDIETESDSEIASEVEDDDTDSVGSLKDFIVDDDLVVSGDEDDVIEAELAAAVETKRNEKAKKLAKSSKPKVGEGATKKATKKTTKKAKSEIIQPHMLGALRQEAGKNQEARRRYMHFLRDNWEDSAKVTQVIQLLQEIQQTNEKTIIFSQWTALLDLIECQVKYKLGLKYCRYTGGMSRAQRDEAVEDFVQNPRNTVMLVSLRAGNAGLNLTVASRVIICDPFWNPYIEMQAVDRAHRIGQQREVKIHQILVKETVEDRILELQEGKRKLVEAALDEGEMKNLGRLSENELRYLFGVQGRPRH